MRYLVYATEAAAQAAVDAIDARARIAFSAFGYEIDADGAIVGKRGGVDDPAGVTATWDVPKRRLDGKWVVAHPETHGSAAVEMVPGVTVASYVMQDLGSPVIETEAADWWPQHGTP